MAAQNGHAGRVERCPVLGGKRKTFARIELFRFGPTPEVAAWVPDAVPADETSTVPLKPAAYETVVPLANPKRVWFEAGQFRLKSRNTTSVSALDCSGDTPARIPNKAHHDCFRR
jgi:hypothetical protein